MISVLVEGDDTNEPIADAARGRLDGHIVLDRALANRNHFPAIDVLASISREFQRVSTEDPRETAGNIRRMLALCKEVEDLVQIGAYRPGARPEVDRALALAPELDAVLQQGVWERSSLDAAAEALADIAGRPLPVAETEGEPTAEQNGGAA